MKCRRRASTQCVCHELREREGRHWSSQTSSHCGNDTNHLCLFLDYSQAKNKDSLTIGGYLPLEVVYNYEPLQKILRPKNSSISLVRKNLWTEYLPSPSKVEYMLFPRLAALSEVLWSAPQHKNWNDFKTGCQPNSKDTTSGRSLITKWHKQRSVRPCYRQQCTWHLRCVTHLCCKSTCGCFKTKWPKDFRFIYKRV